jgi:hypothetical protein
MLVRLICIISLLLTASPLWGVNEYYSISRSIRAMGMGGAFYGLSDDQNALFYNPAGLALYRGTGELMLSLQGTIPSQLGQVINTYNAGTNYSNASAIVSAIQGYQGSALSAGFNLMPFYLRKNFAIGLLIADTKVNAALLGNNFDSSIDVTGVSDTGLFVGFGRQTFDDHLYLGFNAKLMGRVGGHKMLSALDLINAGGVNLNLSSLGGAGLGLDFDIGSTYDFPVPIVGLKNRLSLVVSNLLASDFSLYRISGVPPGLPRLISLGSEVVMPGYKWIDNFNILLDLAEFGAGGQDDQDLGARDGSFFKHVNLGVEIPMNGWFVVRGGIHQGDWTFGLGIETQIVKLELATYAEQLDFGVGRLPSRRFALQLSIGAGSSSSRNLDRVPQRYSEVNLPENSLVQVFDSKNEADQLRDQQIERQPAEEGGMKSRANKDADRFDTDNLAKEAYGK